MHINRNNYEAFFLDYWENKLCPEAKNELARFLEANSDLQDEFLDFRDSFDIQLPNDDKIEFAGKSKLKKIEIAATQNVDENNYEDQIIAHLEGDLSVDETLEYKLFIEKNPHLAGEVNIFKKTFLRADKTINFNDKVSLKRNEISFYAKRFYAFSSAVAAILVISFILFYPFDELKHYSSVSEISNLDILPARTIHLPVITSEIEISTVPADDKNSTGQLKRAFEKKEFLNVETTEHNFTAEAAISPQTENTTKPQTFDISLLPSITNVPDLTSTDYCPPKIELRTQISDILGDMVLRDVLRSEAENKSKKSALERILANLGNQIFGFDYQGINEKSLLGQVAELGKEKISELKDDAPRFETLEEDGLKKTYFALNENFSIRISKKEVPEKAKD